MEDLPVQTRSFLAAALVGDWFIRPKYAEIGA